MFKNRMEEVFPVKTYLSSSMESAITEWLYLEQGEPKLLNGFTPEKRVAEDLISVRFPNLVAREISELVMQSIDCRVESKDRIRAGILQSKIDKHFCENASNLLERVIMLGGLFLKYDGVDGFDEVSPDRFLVTSFDSDGNITGGIFFTYLQDGRNFYTRAEWHRFDGKDADGKSLYKISNRAFKSKLDGDVGRQIPLTSVPEWANILPEVQFHGLIKPLFVYVKNPRVNTVDPYSPLGESVFQRSLPVLTILDTAMSALNRETNQSNPMMVVDPVSLQVAKDHGIEIPPYVMALGKPSVDNYVEQWQPKLQTEERLRTVQWAISYVAVQSGFDASHFMFNGQIISVNTATQVEALERHTINTVLEYRKLFDRPETNGTGWVGYLHDLAYILDVMLTMQGVLDERYFGRYKLYSDFADLTSNEEEDKAFDFKLAEAGYMSKARFLVRHLGVTMEEAIAMVEEAKAEANDGVNPEETEIVGNKAGGNLDEDDKQGSDQAL